MTSQTLAIRAPSINRSASFTKVNPTGCADDKLLTEVLNMNRPQWILI
jgi:hypothetical protein